MSDFKQIDGLTFKDGLLQVVAVEDRTGEVLNLGHMNHEALRRTIETGMVHYYSVSKGRIRMKGETSGNVQKIRKITKNCENDSLLLRVDQSGPACHTGNSSCFYRDLGEEKNEFPGINYSLSILRDLESVIESRRSKRDEGSYTSSLFNKGKEEIYKKFGEESVEVLVAENRERVVYESADMLYHFLVLLAYNGVHLDDVMAELSKRRKGD